MTTHTNHDQTPRNGLDNGRGNNDGGHHRNGGGRSVSVQELTKREVERHLREYAAYRRRNREA